MKLHFRLVSFPAVTILVVAMIVLTPPLVWSQAVEAGVNGYGRAPGWLWIRSIPKGVDVSVDGTGGRGLTVTDHRGTWVVPVRAEGDIVRVGNDPVDIRFLPEAQPLYMVLSSGSRVLHLLASREVSGAPPVVASMLPSSLPTTPLSLAPVSAIVIDDIQPEALTASQVAMLDRWVDLGGTLIVIADRRLVVTDRSLGPTGEINGGDSNVGTMTPLLHGDLFETSTGNPNQSVRIIRSPDGEGRLSLETVGLGRLMNVRLDGVHSEAKSDFIRLALRFLPNRHGGAGGPENGLMTGLGTLAVFDLYEELRAREARTGVAREVSPWTMAGGFATLLWTIPARAWVFASAVLTVTVLFMTRRRWVVGPLVAMAVVVGLLIPQDRMDNTAFAEVFETYAIPQAAESAVFRRTVATTAANPGEFIVTHRDGVLPMTQIPARVVRGGLASQVIERVEGYAPFSPTELSYSDVRRSPMSVDARGSIVDLHWHGFSQAIPEPVHLVIIDNGRLVSVGTITTNRHLSVDFQTGAMLDRTGNGAPPGSEVTGVAPTELLMAIVDELVVRSGRESSRILAVLSDTAAFKPEATDAPVKIRFSRDTTPGFSVSRSVRRSVSVGVRTIRAAVVQLELDR